MEQEYRALAARIEAFELDEPAAVDRFSQRLARENGWSEAYTGRVIGEYKRFLTLAATTTHVVSPSEHVDQAWHLHVLYTARYRQFCSEVLGRQLDHRPSDGACGERAHFVRAYEQTLASYVQRFGEPPPSDIWPNAERRFGEDLGVRRVSTVENWVVAKPRLWLWLRTRGRFGNVAARRALLALGALSVLVCGCSASLSDRADGPSFLRGFLWLWLVTAGLGYALKQLALRSLPPAEPPVLEPYALAQLAGGPTTALDSAITSLLARGCLELDDEQRILIARREAPSGAPAFERGVYARVAATGRMELRRLRSQARELTRELQEGLLKAQLVIEHRAWLPLVLALVAPLVGTFRIASRIGSDKPLSLLGLLTVIATVLAFWVFRRRLERSALGDATVARARETHEPLQGRASAADLAEDGSLPVMFSLFGAAAIVGLPAWSSLFQQRPISYSGGDCGSGGAADGGGGDGDGGGCSGGCGGCGGGCGGD